MILHTAMQLLTEAERELSEIKFKGKMEVSIIRI